MFKIHLYKPLRLFVLWLLKRIDRDIAIRHHWTGDKIVLSLFKHKGYWYHGPEREKNEMVRFKRVIKPTDLIAEVGGHIGYTTLWFAKLAYNGKVIVFEPGQNNLPYIRKNIAKKNNVELVEIGLGSEIGEAVFYEESLTGQNNSFVKDFDGFKTNAAFSKQEQNIIGRVVKIGRLDDYLNIMVENLIL